MGDKNEEEMSVVFKSTPGSRRKTVKITITLSTDNEIPLQKFVLVETWFRELGCYDGKWRELAVSNTGCLY
jgi:hypothetical protein